jgi:hypothetical protein
MGYVSDTSFLIGRLRNGATGQGQPFPGAHPDAVVVLRRLAKAGLLCGPS